MNFYFELHSHRLLLNMKVPYMKLYPSLMGADQLNLKEVINTLEPWCAGFHLDMMDGHAVPNITGGPGWTNAIATYSTKHAWVHCMVTDPLYWVEQLTLKPGSMIDFQYEAVDNAETIIAAIKKMGYKAGVSIAPHTAINAITPLLSHCDYINILGVKPGFSGQAFIPETIHNLTSLRDYIRTHNLTCALACDGGITQQLLPELAHIGVQHVAIASGLFKSTHPIDLLKRYFK